MPWDPHCPRYTSTSSVAQPVESLQKLLRFADETLRGTRLSPQGRLRVDVPVVFGRALLIPALRKFTARYPQLQLEVQLNDRLVDLIAEEVDLVVRVGPVREPHLIARRIVNTRLLTCASPDYLHEHGMPAEPEELRRHKLIGHLFHGNADFVQCFHDALRVVYIFGKRLAHFAVLAEDVESRGRNGVDGVRAY